MLELLFTILIIALIFGLVYWALGLLPIPPPFKNIIIVVMVLIVVIYLIGILAGVSGFHTFHIVR